MAKVQTVNDKEKIVDQQPIAKPTQYVQNHIYPVLPDLPDPTAPLFKPQEVKIPSVINWENSYPNAYQQGDINSCTAEATCGAMAFYLPKFNPSRLFQYYNERVILNTQNSDGGATLSAACHAAQNYGICSESLWPYNTTNVIVKPDNQCYAKAKTNVLTGFYKIITQQSDTLHLIDLAVAAGKPVLAGVVAYPTFETEYADSCGVIEMPASGEAPLGGHCVLIVGYDKIKNLYIFRNSWGSQWGVNGYGFFLPEYLNAYLISCWVIDGAKD